MHAQTLDRPALREAARQPVRSILLVDDDATMVEVLRHRLSSLGFRIQSATSGAEGLEMVRARRPDLVLLDLQLPDVDGLSVCQQLCDDPETCTIPVIILSGLERPDIVRRARAAGCHYFLHKPYDPSALLILIEHTLSEQTRWQAG